MIRCVCVCVCAQSCLTFLWVYGRQPARLLCPWDFPGKDTGVCCHFLLQGIFPSQGSHPGLLYCRRILYCLNHQGSPCVSLKRRSLNLNLSLSCVCFECSVAQLCQTLASPWAVACQALLSMGFPRQEYCSGLPFPTPGDLPHLRIEPMSPASPALAGRFFTTEPPGKANCPRGSVPSVDPLVYKTLLL